VMKVSCQLCGKKFDLEANNYRCPECASHYHVDGEARKHVQDDYHVELKNTYDSNSDNTIYDESKYRYQDLYNQYDEEEEDDDYVLNQDVVEQYRRLREAKAVKEAKTKKRVKTVVIVIEVIVIIFFIMMPFLGKGFSNLQLERQRIDTKPLIEEAYMNEVMPVGYYGVIVRRCYIDDSSRWKLPDNYVVYAVEYDTEENALNHGDELGEPGNDRYNLPYIVKIYLETEDGPTIYPLGRYDAGEFMTKEAYKENIDDVAAFINYEGGILYFVVKEDEEIYGLCFDYYETPDASDENYMELVKVYLMTKIDWEVE